MVLKNVSLIQVHLDLKFLNSLVPAYSLNWILMRVSLAVRDVLTLALQTIKMKTSTMLKRKNLGYAFET